MICFLFLHKKAYHDFILMIKKYRICFIKKNMMIMFFVKSMENAI